MICGTIAVKDILRKPVEQGIQKFIYAFNMRKNCIEFTKRDLSEFLDFENESWIPHRENIRWRPNCYASYCSSKTVHI